MRWNWKWLTGRNERKRVFREEPILGLNLDHTFITTASTDEIAGRLLEEAQYIATRRKMMIAGDRILVIMIDTIRQYHDSALLGSMRSAAFAHGFKVEYQHGCSFMLLKV